MKLKKTVAVLLATAVLSSVTVTGCGKSIDAKATAATLDGKEIPMGVANFIAQYQAVQMDSYLLAFYGTEMWSQDSGDGTTMTESVKKSVMDDIQECYLMDAHAGDYNITLTDEEQTAITDAAAKFIADNTTEAIEKMGATQESVAEMLRLNTIRSKMRTAIGETIDTEVSDKECAQKTFSYVRFEQAQEDESRDTATDDTATDDTQTEETPVTKAQNFLVASANKDMETAAQEGGYTISTCSYGEGDLNEDDNTTGMNLAVLQAADKLKEGELVDSVVEADGVYYAVRMDSTDDKEAAEKKKESILTQRRNDKYTEVLQGYKDDSKWKINDSEWSKVNFDELYTVKAPDTATDDAAGGTTPDETAGGTATDDTTGGTATDDTSGGTATDDATGSTATDDTTGGTTAE